jgi:hypothetical protein
LLSGGSCSAIACESGLNRSRYSDELAPRAESPVASSAVFGCGKAMTAKLKVIVDSAVGGKETLRVAR